MNLQCLLVDKDPPALDTLEEYIRSVDGLTVVARCTDTASAFTVLHGPQPIELLFLDIALTDTDWLLTLPNPPQIIVTTTYSDYTFNRHDLPVLDYLLKPISFERFQRTVEKLLKPTDRPVPVRSVSATDIGQVAFAPATGREPFLYFRAERKLVKVLLRDMLYVESLKDYLKIVLTSGKPLIVKHTLSALETTLPADQFVRVHRSFIIAIEKVTAYAPHQVEVAGQEIPIGRLYQHEVRRTLAVPV